MPVKDYLNAAELLLKSCEEETEERGVFVSTEDPSVITGAVEWTREKEWELYFTGIL